MRTFRVAIVRRRRAQLRLEAQRTRAHSSAPSLFTPRQVLVAMAILTALASATLPTLHVDHSRGSPRRLVDAFGRERLLRGVNLGVEWWRDGDRPFDLSLIHI